MGTYSNYSRLVIKSPLDKNTNVMIGILKEVSIQLACEYNNTKKSTLFIHSNLDFRITEFKMNDMY